MAEPPIPRSISPAALLRTGEEALYEAAFRTGDFGPAEAAFLASLEGASHLGDRAAEAAAFQGLGMTQHYRNIAQLVADRPVPDVDARAEEDWFDRALAIRKEFGAVAEVAESLFSVGLAHQILRQDWSKAVFYFRQALEMAEREAAEGDLYTRSEIHRHIGFYYLVADHQPMKAVRHLEVSLDLRRQFGDERRIPSGLVALGEAQLAASDPDSALITLTEAVERTRAADLSAGWIHEAEQVLAQARTAVGLVPPNL
jgi:tetratricopeptide (TPR) repeat protein